MVDEIDSQNHFDDDPSKYPKLIFIKKLCYVSGALLQHDTEGGSDVVVLQYGLVIVTDGFAVACPYQEAVVDSWVLIVMDDRSDQGCHYL